MKVFISYRRADTQALALLLARSLARMPGLEAVFLDVDDIELAESFRRKILAEMPKASHVFVLIGPQWRGPQGTAGDARIFDADDMVRQEIELALQGPAKVVPILVDGARMPAETELPPTLRPLSQINAFALRTAHFDADTDLLMRKLIRRDVSSPLLPLSLGAVLMRATLGLAAAGLVILAAGLATLVWGGECRDSGLWCVVQRVLGLTHEDDARGVTILLMLAVASLGAVAPFIPRWLARQRGR